MGWRGRGREGSGDPTPGFLIKGTADGLATLKKAFLTFPATRLNLVTPVETPRTSSAGFSRLRFRGSHADCSQAKPLALSDTVGTGFSWREVPPLLF